MAKIRKVKKLGTTERGTKGLGSTGVATPAEMRIFDVDLKRLPLTKAVDAGDTTDNDSDGGGSTVAEGFCPIELLESQNGIESIHPAALSCVSVEKPVTESLLSLFHLAKRWIADTGCGHDMISQKLAKGYINQLVKIRSINLGTANRI